MAFVGLLGFMPLCECFDSAITASVNWHERRLAEWRDGVPRNYGGKWKRKCSCQSALTEIEELRALAKKSTAADAVRCGIKGVTLQKTDLLAGHNKSR
ncbi:hypothetical protein AOLI_G00243490 [Acnodon oligacanthus]